MFAVVAVDKEALRVDPRVHVDRVGVVDVQLLEPLPESVHPLRPRLRGQLVNVSGDDEHGGLRGTPLNVLQPWLQFQQPRLPILDIPHQHVQGAFGEEALVSGVVLCLSPEVPGHKGHLRLLRVGGVLPVTKVHAHGC